MAKKIDLTGLEHFKEEENESIAYIESSSTASKAHKVGERFYFKGKLVICTADIASGGTITLNTNCKLDVLGDDFCELQNALNVNETFFATIPLKKNSTGETIIPDINVIAGHTYKIYAKSSIDVGASVQIGLGYNGNTTVTSQELYNGFTWLKQATVSNSAARVYITQTSGSVEGTVYALIEDITEKVENEELWESLSKKVSSLTEYNVLTKENAILQYKKLTGDGFIREDSNGTRIRVIFDCRGYSNIDVTASCSYGKGAAISEYIDVPKALTASANYIQTLAYEYTLDEISGTLAQGGFVTVSLCKTDGSAFSDNDKADALDALNITLRIPHQNDENYIANKQIEKTVDGQKKLWVGDLVVGRLTGNGIISDTDYRLSTPTIVALPKNSNRKLTVVLNDHFLVGMRTGVASNSLSNNMYWFTSGDTITIPKGHNYFGVSVCYNYGVAPDYNAIPMKSVFSEMIGLKLYYIDNYETIDYEAEKVLNASRLSFYASNPNSIDNLVLIAHTSDCHGDYQRVQNYMDFCDRIGVDVAAITGDIVSYKSSQGLEWFKEIINSAKTLPAVCVGNHDTLDTTSNNDVYSIMFDGIEEKIGNTTEETWYYTDISAKKLRIISVNLFEYGGSHRDKTHFSNDQLSWLCSTLASTPEEYGIILLYHAPQNSLVSARSEQYPKFFQIIRKSNDIFSDVEGSPINDIIDAFISRTTISQTYAQTGSPSSVSVSGDFTEVPSSVDFIAHLTGHFHEDTVCYVPNTTNLQLMLNVVCTNSLYGSTAYPYLCDVSDLPRNVMDITQDSFNVYVIDRENGLVKITRVGSNRTYDMQVRDYMEIPYKSE